MRKGFVFLLILMLSIAGIFTYLTVAQPEYAYVPPDDKVKNEEQKSLDGISQVSLVQDESSEELIEQGKELFYKETFGNEVFFTDIMGLFDGAYTFPKIAKAILQLKGQGTDNLKVEAAETVTIGDRTIQKGELLETGLDVPKGAFVPLGVKFSYNDGRLKAGISCAVCHASVDKQGNVLNGIPNSDLDIGLVLALATNTASFFTHTEIESLKDFIKDENRLVENSEGEYEALPDIEALENFVDREVLKWAKGSNDTTIDFKNNPVQIPDAFTKGDHPFGWSGQGQIGPFNGLSAAINNAHAQNMDTTSQSNISKPVLKIDEEVYLATILQNAANEKFRYDIDSGIKPTDFFKEIDPTPGTEGVNELIRSSTYPKISYVTSIGLFSSSEGYKAWEQINSMSAFMNSLHPPKTNLQVEPTTVSEGRMIFERAGCISCHGGNYLTNNKLISLKEIKTDPSRAKGFKGTEKYFTSPSMYDPETPVPLPENPIIRDVPMSPEQEEQLKIAWAQGNTQGAYKTISLFGLYWSAPYLHDGGVAVGPNLQADIGLPGTFIKGVRPDPRNSLLALIDSRLRNNVIIANQKNEDLKSSHVSGKGHEYWVDETTGYTKAQQQALIDYLLTVTD